MVLWAQSAATRLSPSTLTMSARNWRTSRSGEGQVPLAARVLRSLPHHPQACLSPCAAEDLGFATRRLCFWRHILSIQPCFWERPRRTPCSIWERAPWRLEGYSARAQSECSFTGKHRGAGQRSCMGEVMTDHFGDHMLCCHKLGIYARHNEIRNELAAVCGA